MDDKTTYADPFGHAATIRRLFAAFTDHDRPTIEELLAPECVWRVPGVNALAGEYVGRPAVFDLFRALRRRFRVPAQFEIVDITSSVDRAIVFQHGIAQLSDRDVRLKECLVFRFAAGRIVEVDEFQFDQNVFDEAFSADSLTVAGPPESQGRT